MRRLTALLLCLALCLLPAPQAGAHSGDKHGEDIYYVLFGKDWKSISLDEEQTNKRYALLCATQLCIDQFNNNSEEYLNSLREMGYIRLPESVKEINLSATPQNHRSFTHKGWDYNYSSDPPSLSNPHWDARWQQRKKLLTDVAEQIFDFDGRWELLDKILPYPCTVECEAFCKLLYYIHLTSDHTAFETSSYNRVVLGQQGKDQVMPLAATRGDSVISELQEVIVELFGKEEASDIVRDLDTINSEIVKLLNDPDAMRTEEGVKQYTDYAQDVLDTLAKYIPNLLKEKDFFSKVFY